MLQIIGYILILGALGVICFFCGRNWYRDIKTALSGGGCSGCGGKCSGCSGNCASCGSSCSHGEVNTAAAKK